ncbi:MAG: hypothetical protein V4714_19160 [Bacteroidota bacterium]
MKILRFLLPATAFVFLFAACQQHHYQSYNVISKKKPKAYVRYYKHQNEGLRLSSAATKYNVNRNNYQSEGLRLSSGN